MKFEERIATENIAYLANIQLLKIIHIQENRIENITLSIPLIVKYSSGT